MSDIRTLIRLLIAFIPLLLMVRRNGRLNLKPIYRSRQFPMPAAALIFSVVVIVLLGKIIGWCGDIVDFIADKLALLGGVAAILKTIVSPLVEILLRKSMYVIAVTLNYLLMLAYLFIKGILLPVFMAACKPGDAVYEAVSEWLYEPDDDGNWYVQKCAVQGRSLLKVFYYSAIVLSIVLFFVSSYLYEDDWLQLPFVPVLGIIIIGEMYFYINGITKEEAHTHVSGEADKTNGVVNYTYLRRVLRGLYGDKLMNDQTAVSSGSENPVTAEELIEKSLQDDSRSIETYGKYMNRYRLSGHAIDQNYYASGLELLKGKSILFSNPFYYDLIPYAFYAMNHKLLQHKKVLIILGRHGIENDVAAWCEAGLLTVTNVRGLWRIGVLSDKEQDLDVGIVTRSGVQDLMLHRANAEFFADAEFVVLIEPSKLISTAQVGLNSLIRYCRSNAEKKITFCSTDKNCDGLIDALSHALMTSLSEVASTEVHEGTASYMCWTVDEDYWQHRMLPNISRYLGIGTELSFVALKNDVSKTEWFGGERFPVTDIHWIAKQYYGELMGYSELAASQELFDNVFKTSPNLWDAKKVKNSYLTVEDESNNLFEMKREFLTRTTEQSFVNIISSPYLLCDYMAENQGIFNADSKAIPYIVADYAMTERNVLLRLFVQMAAGFVWEKDVKKELLLAGIDDSEPLKVLWEKFCIWYNPIGSPETSGITVKGYARGKEYRFENSVVLTRKKYNTETGREETCYYIDDELFIRNVLGDLANARYVAEEDSENNFIGTEIRGQVFQKHLPGQFFTLCGKYYEMLNVTYDNRIIVRRAADHIHGRPVYRQERKYTIHAAADDSRMGSARSFGDWDVIRQFADISVETPAYWELPTYQDFAHGRRVVINGIHERCYNNKRILKISFKEITDEVRYTLTALFNEVFRTLFAENQDMIVAVTAGECGVPLTYGLSGDCDAQSIYILEDCQYDIGFLTAVERNLTRIFQIICDYLQWNEEEIKKSEEIEAGKDFAISDAERAEEEKEAEKEADKAKEKKPGFFGRIIEKIKSLFRKKPKEKKPEENSGDIPEEKPGEEPAQETDQPAEGEDVVSDTGENEGSSDESAEKSESAEIEGEEAETADGDKDSEGPADEVSEDPGTEEDGSVSEEESADEDPEKEIAEPVEESPEGKEENADE